MCFQQEFANFHAAAEAVLRDSAKSSVGFNSVKAADDALRVLEDRVTELDRALAGIYNAIEKAQS